MSETNAIFAPSGDQDGRFSFATSAVSRFCKTLETTYHIPTVGAAAANDVNQLTLKYTYKFSKRTEAFAAYASKKTNGATSVTATTVGGGLVHSF